MNDFEVGLCRDLGGIKYVVLQLFDCIYVKEFIFGGHTPSLYISL